MFKHIEELQLVHQRNTDILSIPYEADEETLMKRIYDLLTDDEHNKNRLTIIIDSLDEDFLGSILSSFDAFKSLGYRSIGIEAHIYQDVDNELLSKYLDKYNIPIKIQYYLSSSDDNIRKRLEEDIRIRIDPDMVSMKRYQESILDNPILSKGFKKYHRNLHVSELIYELIEGTNASLFECALLQYYAKRYNLAVKLIGDEECIHTWECEITKYSPDITLIGKNDKVRNKVLNKKIG